MLTLKQTALLQFPTVICFFFYNHMCVFGCVCLLFCYVLIVTSLSKKANTLLVLSIKHKE